MTFPHWFRPMWRFYAAIISALLLMALVAATIFGILAGIVYLTKRPKLPPAATSIQLR